MAERVGVAVIGAGFSGIAMGVRLLEAGIDDFVIVDRADDVGGVWEANTYPGCRCDIPSHLYSLSFAPNADWSNTFSPQAEIRDYLRRTADEFGLRRFLRLGVAVESMAWDERDAVWRVQTTSGELIADIVVSGVGPLTEPKLPDVPGLTTFEGVTMHSARWDHSVDFTGKRVASIGTGASAIQYVPQIAKTVDHLYVYQRSAPWIMPKRNRDLADWEHELYHRAPLAQKAVRTGIYSLRELLAVGFVKRPELMHRLEKISLSYLEAKVEDPELRAILTPDYLLGCKRLLPSHDWYRALTRDNVTVVPHALTEVRPRGVVGADGIEREVDLIVFGTGFHVSDMPIADLVRGRDGIVLSDRWKGSPKAYLGTSVPGYPNLFMTLGPNTGVGHGSMIYMIESQVEHIVRRIRAMRSRGMRTIEVTQHAYDDYNREVDERLAGTVWALGGCTNFYMDANGRNATQWPDWTFRFRRLTRRADPTAYVATRHVPAEVGR